MQDYTSINEKESKNFLIRIFKAIFGGLFNIRTIHTRENLDGTVSVNIRLEKNKK
jgi:hypothetical protein